MKLLDTRSLWRTVDAVNDALFFERTIPAGEARRVARWLAGRQGLARSYAGMFAPTDGDYRTGFKLFTGERIATGAATGHILGEEACRALLLLGSDAAEVRSALGRAERSMDRRLLDYESGGRRRGFF